MAIEINTRTKILAGVVVLAAAGAGAWFFLLQDEPPPTPAAKAPAKPAAEAAKGAPAADAPKAAEAAKPAAPAVAKAPPKPVPTDPPKVVAEILETSGTKALIQQLPRYIKSASAGNLKDPAGIKELNAQTERLLEPIGLLAEVSLSLTKSYDANRMPRYLQMRREPAVQKIVAMKTELLATPENAQEALIDKAGKSPPPEARAKLVARIEEVDRPLAFDADVNGTFLRAQADGMLEYLQTDKNAKAVLTELGDGNPRNARPAMLARVDGKRGERIRSSIRFLNAALRDATEQELADYLKLVDTEIGEWGANAIAGAMDPALIKRMREQVRVFAKLQYGGKAEMAKAPAKGKPAAEEAAAEKPAVVASAKPPAAPKERPAYQRPPNIRDAYSRYNDLVTATVMRDRVAVKELLDDGKRPNVRQADGTTPLMIAAGNGDADLVQMLLAKGADPNLRATGGATALSIAKGRRRADVVQLLERSGAKN